MPDETAARAERAAQLVDEPTDTATDDEVYDRNEHGSPAAVTTPDTDRVVDDTRVGEQRDERMPGEMGASAVGAIWSMDAASSLRGRWQELQLRFVDDPRTVVTEAQALVDEAVQGVTRALTGQQAELDGWAASGNGDTETLRVALQRYREFFDRVLSQSRS